MPYFRSPKAKRDERGLTANQALFVGYVTLGYSYRQAAEKLELKPGALQGWFRSKFFRQAIEDGRFDAVKFLKDMRMEMGLRTWVEMRKLFDEATDQRLRLEICRVAGKMAGLEAPMKHEHEHTFEMNDNLARSVMERAELEIAEKWRAEGKITDAQFEELRKERGTVLDIPRPALPGGEGTPEEAGPPDEAPELPPASEPETPDRGV